METKICKICGIEKELDQFRKRDKWYLNVCKQCENEQCKKRSFQVMKTSFFVC